MIPKYDLLLSVVDLIFELNFGGTHSQYEDLNNCKKSLLLTLLCITSPACVSVPTLFVLTAQYSK